MPGINDIERDSGLLARVAKERAGEALPHNQQRRTHNDDIYDNETGLVSYFTAASAAPTMPAWLRKAAGTIGVRSFRYLNHFL